jgi:hypothetical protein
MQQRFYTTKTQTGRVWGQKLEISSGAPLRLRIASIVSGGSIG